MIVLFASINVKDQIHPNLQIVNKNNVNKNQKLRSQIKMASQLHLNIVHVTDMES